MKRLQTPNKQGDDGWKSVQVNGVPLHEYRTQYIKLNRPVPRLPPLPPPQPSHALPPPAPPARNAPAQAVASQRPVPKVKIGSGQQYTVKLGAQREQQGPKQATASQSKKLSQSQRQQQPSPQQQHQQQQQQQPQQQQRKGGGGAGGGGGAHAAAVAAGRKATASSLGQSHKSSGKRSKQKAVAPDVQQLVSTSFGGSACSCACGIAACGCLDQPCR